MKGRKVIALVLAVILLCTASLFTASAESEMTPYEEAMTRYKEMQQNTIHVRLNFHAGYTTKASKFYARKVTGVNEDGSFILGWWELVHDADSVFGYTDYQFDLPQTYVQFGYSFDIVWGTDWPYSKCFWNKTNTPVDDIFISIWGFVRSAGLTIRVNDKEIYSEFNLPAGKEWKPC